MSEGGVAWNKKKNFEQRVDFHFFERLVVKSDFDSDVEFSPTNFMNFVRRFGYDSDGVFETGMEGESDTLDEMGD